MATLTIPYSFTAGNSAIAADVNANFTAIKNFIDTYTVQNSDGAGLATTSSYTAGSVTSNIIANDTIVNADINSAAGIVDTKLATIATALKVANSATTATSANTASAIVARDASGNFAAGTITAALTGNASTATTATSATSATTATNLAGMTKGSTVITMYADEGIVAHGLGVVPSTVIACNGDSGAYGGAILLRPAGTNSTSFGVYGAGISSSTSVRINWIAFA